MRLRHHHDGDRGLHASSLTLVDLALQTARRARTAAYDGRATFDVFGHSVRLRRLFVKNAYFQSGKKGVSACRTRRPVRNVRCSFDNRSQVRQARDVGSGNVWESELRAHLVHDFSSLACRNEPSTPRNAVPGQETARGVEALALVCVFRGLSDEARRAKKPVSAGGDVFEASEESLGILVREGRGSHLCEDCYLRYVRGGCGRS